MLGLCVINSCLYYHLFAGKKSEEEEAFITSSKCNFGATLPMSLCQDYCTTNRRTADCVHTNSDTVAKILRPPVIHLATTFAVLTCPAPEVEPEKTLWLPHSPSCCSCQSGSNTNMCPLMKVMKYPFTCTPCHRTTLPAPFTYGFGVNAA